MLTAYLTDLLGNHLALVKAIPAQQGGSQTRVERPFRAVASASVRISMSDETAMVALTTGQPNSRMLKVYYRPPGQAVAQLVFWGVAGKPVLSYAARVVTVNANDQAFRARRAFAPIFGSPGGTAGVTVDGRGLETIWSTIDDYEVQHGNPSPGVVPIGGRHGPTHDGAKVVMSDGQSFQDFAEAVANAIDGPDWELRPLDTTLGEEPEGISSSVWHDMRDAAGEKNAYYAQLHTWDRKLTDRTKDVQFAFGTGVSNLEDLEVDVSGEQQANAVAVGVSGSEQGTDTSKTSKDAASIAAVGTYSQASSLSVDAKNGASNALAQQTADAQIEAYKAAPIFLTLTVKKDETARFHAFFDFELGDLVHVAGRQGFAYIPYKGGLVQQVPARVTGVVLAEDSAGRVQQTITAVTNIDTDDATTES